MRYPQAATTGVLDDERPRAEPVDPLVQAISLTSEVCGLPLSSAAAEMLARDLAGFNERAVLDALARCRLELQGPLKTSDIIVRIEDGRPDADEAWAMMPRTESSSVVWTDEMAQAWGVASPLLQAGDISAAHAAFTESYTKAVLRARIHRTPAHWTPSLGSDVAGRERVLLEAVKKKRLSAEHAERLLPDNAIAAQAREVIKQLHLKKLH
ncbi:MAG: hypothetical protein ACO1NO_01900 [Burkholderiaceae bacterium]